MNKCFDTTDHTLLLAKMERHGIVDDELMWFCDSLTGRTQAVLVNSPMSEFDNVLTGVPQGSVLGPILFLIFINDLPSCLSCTAHSSYADDAEIHACGNTVHESS